MYPPRPTCPEPVPVRSERRADRAATRFVSAEDFDPTGILAGVDPCESRYWWLPELGGNDSAG